MSVRTCAHPQCTHTHTRVNGRVFVCVPHPFCQQQEVLTGHKFARRLVNETLLYLHFFPARCFFFFSTSSTFSWLPLALAALLLALSNIFSQLAVAIFRLLPLKNGYLLSPSLSLSLSVCLPARCSCRRHHFLALSHAACLRMFPTPTPLSVPLSCCLACAPT